MAGTPLFRLFFEEGMLNAVTILGLGYIGLPTATLLAARKKKVLGVDISPSIVDAVNQGKIHIAEPELDILVQAAVGAGYLRAATRPEPADVFLIAVPTPLTHERKPDLTHIQSAACTIAPLLAKGNLVILESTSPVGTTDKVAGWLAGMRPDLSFPQQTGMASDIRIAYCPERVLPGRIVHELVANDRVIGGMTSQCTQAAVALYKLFVRGECVVTDARTAEMCKLAENSYRDVNIAFANEISMICDAQNIDIWELIRLANRHPRVNILQPGCGVGGHCIAIDPWFIVDSTPRQARLVRVAREVNDAKSEWVVRKVEQAVHNLAGKGHAANDLRISCFGLTFKPDVNDLRESPALRITVALAKRYAGKVAVVEPNLQVLPEALSDAQVVLMDLDDAITRTNILVVLVDHAQFKCIKPHRGSQQVFIDTRGIWNVTK